MANPQISATFLTRLRALVRKDMAREDFSIEYVCRELAISRTQLHRRIKEATGQSTSLYIRQIRMERARELLEQTELNVSEVAYATGESSPQNLSKYFQQAYGLSPTAYRKQLTEDKVVEAVADPVTETEPPSLPDENSSNYRVLSMLLLAAVTLLAGWLIIDNGGVADAASRDASPHPRTVALLPLQIIGEFEDEYLVAGISEDLRTQLSKQPGMRVPANQTTALELEKNPTLPQLARRLGADYLLEGSIRQLTTTYRLNVRLLDPQKNQTVWGETFDLAHDELVDLQTTVAQKMTAALGLPPIPRYSSLPQRFTDHPEAYRALLRSRQLRLIRTEASLLQAINILDGAISLDPGYADAYAQRAAIRSICAQHGYAGDRQLAEYARSDADARRALELNPNDATAYLTIGRNLRYRGQNGAAIQNFERALSLDPGNGNAMHSLGLSYEMAGRWEAAREQYRMAYEIDPLRPANVSQFVYINALMGDEKAARQLLVEGSAEMEGNLILFWAQGSIELYAGKNVEALPLFEAGVAAGDSAGFVLLDLFYCRGRVNGRASLTENLRGIDPDSRWGLMVRAITAAGYRDHEEALALLLSIEDIHLVFNQTTLDTYFYFLRGEPAYEQLLLDLGHGHISDNLFQQLSQPLAAN